MTAKLRLGPLLTSVLLALATIPALAQSAADIQAPAPGSPAADPGAAAATSPQAAENPVPQGADTSRQPATLTFLFDRPGLAVPHFVLTIHEDGSGRYQADEAPVPAAGGGEVRHIDRPVPVSAATVARLFAAAREEKYFDLRCDSRIKNLANTGKKVLSYTGPDGSGSCTYNYSELKDIQMLTDTFLAMAFTLDEGRKLEFKKRFDRLGLDAEMASLAHAAEQKQAIEMGTISGILTQIAGDTELMERVRLRAAKLLESSQPNP